MRVQLSLLALALPAFGAVRESLSALPLGWKPYKGHSVSSGTTLKLNVALQYKNMDSLEARLAAVSTPGSPEYGQYIDLAEQEAIFGPSNATESKVISWVKASGGKHITSSGGIVSFGMSVGDANKMLAADYGLYTDGQTVKLRTMSYSVPDALGDAVDLLYPTTFFGSMKAQRAVPSKTAKTPMKRQLQPSCETTIPYGTHNYTVITPLCLKELYNIGDYTADPSCGSDVAFGSFLNESASYSDLAMYESINNIPSQNFSVLALINGGVDNQDPATELDGEANLDVQNIIGLVDGLPVGEYITGGLAPIHFDLLEPNASLASNEPYLPYYQYLLSQPNSNLPYVITNSYGDDENTVPESYAKRVCNMIGMMGLRGRTVLESSGDTGVGAVCLTNGLTGPPQFTPQFPGTCPYITAVGGTVGGTNGSEQAWDGSSGGFSNYFGQAFYQGKAVETYLSKYISAATKEYYSSSNYTNFNMRGFPDISAHSVTPDYLTVTNGSVAPSGGTSAASPVVAAIMALLNDARFRAGKPALGFVNPLLYSLAANTSAINDITQGAAIGCNGVNTQSGQPVPGSGIIPYASWNATTGWDPVTGLGTPNFQNLKNVVLSVC